MEDTNPETGSVQSMEINEAADALAKFRQAPQKDKPQTEAQAEAEPETEEVEGAEQSAESDVAETQEDEPGESEPEAVIEISLPSGDKITAEEAARGYLRQSDYTRKTQSLAEERKAIERDKAEVIPRLHQLVQALSAHQEQQPDWQKLALELDPHEYNQKRAEWEHKSILRHAAAEELKTHQARKLQNAQREVFTDLSKGDFEPEWKDEKKLTDGLSKIHAFATEFGVPAEMLGQIDNPVFVKILELARRQVEGKKAANIIAKVVKPKPKPELKAGAKKTTPQSERAIEQAKNRFNQTKTEEDAVAVLRAMRQRAS